MTAAVALVLSFSPSALIADTIDFDELTLDPDSFFDGYGSSATRGSWQSAGARFNTNQWGPGWSYSNVDDTTTPGFTNQWAAYTGSDFSGSGNYAMANSFSPNGAVVNLPTLVELMSLRATNSTYAGISMRDGDAFGKQFGGPTLNDPDWFRVTFTGFTQLNARGDETGSAELYLADFRFADNTLDYILDQWTMVDLSGIAASRSFGISFDGSDVGGSGLNTPAYVAIDNIEFQVVPEPSSIGLIIMFATTCFLRRRKN